MGKIPNATHAKKQFDLKAFYAFQNLYCDLRDLTLRIHIDFFSHDRLKLKKKR